jgi:cellobiose phosphorylase
MADFDQLREGKVQVKAGWRIYSSGPGIFMNQLISNVLGLRLKKDTVILDPVLPDKLDGLTFDFKIGEIPVRIIYEIKDNGPVKAVYINDQAIEFTALKQPYRSGGACFAASYLRKNCRIRITK